MLHGVDIAKKLAPVWDELAGVTKEAIPNLIIAKVDATANSLPDSVSISGFPTLILFKNGEKTIYSGPRDVDSLVGWLKTNANAEAAAEKEDL